MQMQQFSSKNKIAPSWKQDSVLFYLRALEPGACRLFGGLRLARLNPKDLASL
jgi:hypothetical protein